MEKIRDKSYQVCFFYFYFFCLVCLTFSFIFGGYSFKLCFLLRGMGRGFYVLRKQKNILVAIDFSLPTHSFILLVLKKYESGSYRISMWVRAGNL